MQEEMRKFDLNIERVLEHWTVAHGLREVIANALDEAALSSTQAPDIYKDETGTWHIRDHGRGLRYEHLTQNENKEKLRYSELVIGKFGVGLKDALATFDRHHIDLQILSPHGDIMIGTVPKHGFTDLKTLHALITPASNPQRIGTEFVLQGLKDEEIAKAKDFFLAYSGDIMLASTSYGLVLQRPPQAKCARIYVNGLFVAEEENFLFSYNITSLTTDLRKALNRERTNVGRTAYTKRIKDILLDCQDAAVADHLAHDLQQLERGSAHDELQWIDVQLHACQILNTQSKVVFVTADQLLQGGSLISHAQGDGYHIVVIPQTLATKLPRLQDIVNNPINTLDQYVQEWNNSFQYTFVDPTQLTPQEQSIWGQTKAIMSLLHMYPIKVKQILISETMRLNTYNTIEVLGVWVEINGHIIIKRSQLRDLSSFAGTLLHECVHAITGADDETLLFEDGLTRSLGAIATQAIK